MKTIIVIGSTIADNSDFALPAWFKRLDAHLARGPSHLVRLILSVRRLVDEFDFKGDITRISGRTVRAHARENAQAHEASSNMICDSRPP